MARNLLFIVAAAVVAIVGWNYFQNQKDDDVRIELPGGKEVQIDKGD